MAEGGSPKSLFRVRSAHGHHRVTFVELFFDLVFVFAVTQLSHSLLEHFSPTYLHLPIVLGIVLSAVGDELLLAHPVGHVETKTVIGVVGGPLAYIVGVVLFKRSIRGWFQLSHLVGIGALIVLGGVGKLLSPLLLAAATALTLVMVAAWESLSLGKKSPA